MCLQGNSASQRVEIAFDAIGLAGSDAGMGGKKDSDFWTALHGELGHALACLPSAQEPEIVHYDHPDELWKEQAQILPTPLMSSAA